MIESSSPLRILVVEENENQKFLFRQAFQKSAISCEITGCQRAENALEQLSADTQSFDVIAVDQNLPDISGMDLCRKLLDMKIPPPLVFLADIGSEQLVAEALMAGVHDYIIKDPRGGYLELLPMSLTKTAIRHSNRLIDERTEDRLSESEQIFKTIFDNAPDGILLADVETKKFYMGNNIICQMLGIDREEINDLGVMDIVPEQDLPYVLEQFEKQARGELTLARDIPVKRKNGGVLFADINAFPIKLDGKTYLMGIFRNVSEHKIAEEKWRSLVETAPGFIMTVSEDGTIQFLNRPTGGLTIEQAIGTTVYEHVEPGQCDIMRRSIEKVFKTGEPGSYEILGLGYDGPNSAWYETHLGPVIREGRVVAVTMISTNITERKKAEEALRSSERQFKEIFENTAVGMYRTMPDGRILVANPALVRMLGFSTFEELNQRNLEEEGYEPCYARSAFKERIEKEDQIVGLESQWITRDGTMLVVIENARVVRDDSGKILYYEGTAEDITQRKKAENALKQSEEKFRLAMEATNDALWDWNMVTNEVYRNPRHATMLGYESNELTASQDEWEKQIHPDDKQAVFQILDEYLADKRNSFKLEYRLRTKSGDYVWVLGRGKVVAYNNDGSPARMIGTNIDITDRKQMEKAIRMSEEKYRAFFEYDLTGDFISTPDGDLIDCNQAFLDLFGFTSKEEAKSITLDSIYPTPGDREVMLDKIRKEREIFHYVHEARKITGETIFIDQNTIGEFDDDNNLILMRGHIIDITERKQAEEEIRKFKTISDKAGHGVAIADLQGNLVYVNDSFAQMHLYSADEIIGKNLATFHNEEQMERVNRLNEQLKQQGIYVAEEVWHKKRDNTVFPTLMSATLIRDESGEPLFMAATAIDITKHKKAEESLHNSEKRYRSVVEDSPVLMCSFLPDSTISFVNTAYCEYFGKTHEELLGSKFTSLISEKDRQGVLDNILALTVDSPTITHEHKVTDADGHVRWQRWTNRALFDEPGRAVSFQSFGEDITERRNSEEALQESELRYHTLFGILPVGVGLSTLDGRIIDANSTFQRMMGYSIEEMRRTNALDTYYNPTERASLLKQMQKDGFVRGFEVQLKRKDGTIFLADLNVTTMRMRGETVSVTVARDITEHRRIERALAGSEEKYRTLVECAGDPISTIDERGVFLFANKVAAETLGYQPEDLVGKTLWDFFPKEMADQSAANVRKVIETGQRINTVSLREEQGQPRWYNVITEPLKDNRGNVTAAMIIARNVDDMKRAEEQIHKLSSAVESSISGIAIGDAEGNMTYVNRAFLEMWGYDHENEVLGRNIIELWEMRDEAENVLNMLRDINGWIGELTAKRKDGSIFDVQICATLVTDENGKPISMMGSFVDISETKRKEEELSKYRGQMARAEQLASLGTLSATVAHQLTQPLTVIRLSMDNALDELEATSSSETVIRRLKESVTQVSNITSIIERFRNFARKSSGRTVAEVNLKTVAVRIAMLLSESARSANILLRIRDMGDLPCPWMNETDLEQLFFALFENAIQAADHKKTRQLVVSGAVKDKHIELRFSDDCGGISPENLDKIFEPFFTTKPRGQGTGLGLCIVQDAVSRIGGHVHVESKFGKGTTFIISFPVEKGKIS